MPQSTRTHTHYLEVCLHAVGPAHKVLPAAGTHPAYLRLEAAASAEEVARLALHDPSPGHRTRSLSLENSPRPPLDILLARPSMFQVTMRPLITPDCSATSASICLSASSSVSSIKHLFPIFLDTGSVRITGVHIS